MSETSDGGSETPEPPPETADTGDDRAEGPVEDEATDSSDSSSDSSAESGPVEDVSEEDASVPADTAAVEDKADDSGPVDDETESEPETESEESRPEDDRDQAEDTEPREPVEDDDPEPAADDRQEAAEEPEAPEPVEEQPPPEDTDEAPEPPAEDQQDVAEDTTAEETAPPEDTDRTDEPETPVAEDQADEAPPPADTETEPPPENPDDFERELELKPDDPRWDGDWSQSTPAEQQVEPAAMSYETEPGAEIPGPEETPQEVGEQQAPPEIPLDREVDSLGTEPAGPEIENPQPSDVELNPARQPDQDRPSQLSPEMSTGPADYKFTFDKETGQSELVEKQSADSPAGPKEHLPGDVTGGAWREAASPEDGGADMTYSEKDGWRAELGEERKTEPAEEQKPEETIARRLSEDGQDVADGVTKLYEAGKAVSEDQPKTVTSQEQPRYEPATPDAPASQADPIGSAIATLAALGAIGYQKYKDSRGVENASAESGDASPEGEGDEPPAQEEPGESEETQAETETETETETEGDESEAAESDKAESDKEDPKAADAEKDAKDDVRGQVLGEFIDRLGDAADNDVLGAGSSPAVELYKQREHIQIQAERYLAAMKRMFGGKDDA